MCRTRLMMVVALIAVAAAYVAVIDWFVLTDCKMSWKQLGWDDILWILAPAVLLLLNAAVLLLVKETPEVQSQYSGTKYPWL